MKIFYHTFYILFYTLPITTSHVLDFFLLIILKGKKKKTLAKYKIKYLDSSVISYY